jgi:hypothetical protein
VDVVGDGQSVSVVASRVNSSLKVVLGTLDLLLGEQIVVVGVEIEGCDDVAEGLQVLLAGCRAACGVWRTHVGRVFSDDIADSHLVLDHLVDTLFMRNKVEILMRPGMTGDLVTLCVHVGDNASPVLVDRALTKVVASDEESGLPVVGLELVQDLLSVDVGAIIVGNSNSFGLQASTDTNASVLDASELRTVVVRSGSSVRSLVRVAPWTKVDLTIRCCTEIFAGAAVPL